MKEIINKIRKENMSKILERVRYDAYADDCSTYSATKNGLYNIRVKEAVL